MSSMDILISHILCLGFPRQMVGVYTKAHPTGVRRFIPLWAFAINP